MTVRYVHTVGKPILNNSLEKRLLEPWVQSYLYSFYNGFPNGSNFGNDTVIRVSEKFKTFKENMLPGEDLMADSGGYSIIAGDIHPRDIRKFMQCYWEFLTKYNKYFDTIFSLDIPIFLKYGEMNTKQRIFTYNHESCEGMKKILEAYPELYNKFLFVWQWKIPSQFKIWNTLYDEHFKDAKNLHHFAIGGLVSLRSMANLKFVPYVGPIYKVLKIIMDKNLKKTSIIHLLGQYGRAERFIMAFLDVLFNKYYLKDKQCDIEIRYDTINYQLTGLYKVREAIILDLLDDKENLNQLEDFIPDEGIRALVVEEIAKIQSGHALDNPVILGLTYVIYSRYIDDIFAKTIEEYDLLNFFLSHTNFNQMKNNLEFIIRGVTAKYPLAFKGIGKDIIESFKWILGFHTAIMDGASTERIDAGVFKFIEAVNFPYKYVDD